MSSYALLSRGTFTGYSSSGFVFSLFLIAYGLSTMSADQYSTFRYNIIYMIHYLYYNISYIYNIIVML
jgi:hypothetical protein